VGAALLAVGLSWWEALASHIIGGLFILAGLILAAWAGVKYGIPFPVYVRSSFGFHGAQFCTITRGVVAIMWLSFQVFNHRTYLNTKVYECSLTRIRVILSAFVLHTDQGTSSY
jgi:NCS1 family nucleobase:cation symporter-1